MNPHDPADPSAQTPRHASQHPFVPAPRSALWQILVPALLVCLLVLLVALLVSGIRLSNRLSTQNKEMRDEITLLKGAPPVISAEEAQRITKTLGDLVKAHNDLGSAYVALKKEVDDLKSRPVSDGDDKKKRRDDSGPGNSAPVTPPDNPRDPRMVFVRIGTAEIKPRDTNPELYPVPVGIDHASRWFCVDSQAAKGLIAVSRDARLRARVIMPSDKKVGWKVWKYVTGNEKVEDISLSTSGEYVQLDNWAKGEKIQFYLAEVGDDKTPLQIKVYEE